MTNLTRSISTLERVIRYSVTMVRELRNITMVDLRKPIELTNDENLLIDEISPLVPDAEANVIYKQPGNISYADWWIVVSLDFKTYQDVALNRVAKIYNICDNSTCDAHGIDTTLEYYPASKESAGSLSIIIWLRPCKDHDKK